MGLANIINEAFLSQMLCRVSQSAKKLSKLNPCKAHGLDNIPRWLLKDHTEILAGPVSDILNYSYREGRLPSIWKHADVVPTKTKARR